jgi:hypothetical protein
VRIAFGSEYADAAGLLWLFGVGDDRLRGSSTSSTSTTSAMTAVRSLGCSCSAPWFRSALPRGARQRAAGS